MLQARVVSKSVGVAWYALTRRELDAWLDGVLSDTGATEITLYAGPDIVYDAWRWDGGTAWESEFRPPADWDAIDSRPNPRP